VGDTWDTGVPQRPAAWGHKRFPSKNNSGLQLKMADGVHASTFVPSQKPTKATIKESFSKGTNPPE